MCRRLLMLLMFTLAATTLTRTAIAAKPNKQSKPGKKAAELNWARQVAQDFMGAAFRGDTEQAENLLDPALKQIMAQYGEPAVREWLNNQIANRGFFNPKIDAEEISPDRDEAHFRGVISREMQTWEFTMRVAKVAESGKWRVAFFRFAEREKQPQ